jgi:hypothetical protein
MARRRLVAQPSSFIAQFGRRVVHDRARRHVRAARRDRSAASVSIRKGLQVKDGREAVAIGLALFEQIGIDLLQQLIFVPVLPSLCRSCAALGAEVVQAASVRHERREQQRAIGRLGEEEASQQHLQLVAKA